MAVAIDKSHPALGEKATTPPDKHCICIRPERLRVFVLAALVKLCSFTVLVSAKRGNCAVRQVHLAVGDDPATTMTVSFSSPFVEGCRDLTPFVLVGTEAGSLGRAVFQTSPARQYNATLSRTKGDDDRVTTYTSNLFHHITVRDLSPNTKYYYKCGLLRTSHHPSGTDGILSERISRELKRGKLSSSIEHLDSTAASFSSAPSPGSSHSVKFAVLGDMGMHKKSVLNAKMILHDPEIRALFLAGDISYADTDHHLWDDWFHKMRGLLRNVPVQTAPGNHEVEVDWASNDIFAAYENRFSMPKARDAVIEASPKKQAGAGHLAYPLVYEYGNSYHAFTYGGARVIFLNSFSSCAPRSKQYTWFADQLKSIDRSVTPWVFVVFHCPIYNTFKAKRHSPQSKAMNRYLEPLFVQYRVNMVFSGHVHAYMRTKNVVYGVVNEVGPQYVIIGDGGQGAGGSFFSDVQEDWVQARDHTATGFGTVSLLNKTHARWNWVHTAKGHEGVHDSAILVNHFFVGVQPVNFVASLPA